MAVRLLALACLLPLLVHAQIQPRLVYRAAPVYPELAKAMRIQGTVRLAAVIDADGTVAALKLICGHPLLVRAAMEAARKWRYLPASIQPRSPHIVIRIALTFSIDSLDRSGRSTHI